MRSLCAAAVIVTTALEDVCEANNVAWLAAGDEDAEVRLHKSTDPPPSPTTIDVKV